jgi:Na+/H+-dicarboxylate symporter
MSIKNLGRALLFVITLFAGIGFGAATFGIIFDIIIHPGRCVKILHPGEKILVSEYKTFLDHGCNLPPLSSVLVIGRGNDFGFMSDTDEITYSGDEVYEIRLPPTKEDMPKLLDFVKAFIFAIIAVVFVKVALRFWMRWSAAAKQPSLL